MAGVPVLLVGGLAFHPPAAIGALHLFREVFANISFFVASATISHHSVFGWALTVRGVDFSHPLHCESVDIDPFS